MFEKMISRSKNLGRGIGKHQIVGKDKTLVNHPKTDSK